MPRIPQSTRANFISTEVPSGLTGGSPGQAMAKANQQMGQTLEEVGRMGMNLAVRRQNATDQKFAFDSAIKDSEELAAFSKERQDREDYTQAIEEWIEDRASLRREQAPNQKAADLYEQKVSRHFSSQRIKARDFVQKREIESAYTSISDNANQVSNSLIVSPDVESANEYLNTFEAQVREQEGNLFDKATSEEIIKESHNKIAIGLFKGLQTTENFQSGIQLLESQEGLATKLTPQQTSTFMRAFNSLREQEERQSFNKLNQDLGDVAFALSKGEDVDSNVVSGIRNQLEAIPSKFLDKDQKTRALDKLDSAVIVNSTMRRAHSMTNAELLNSDEVVEAALKDSAPSGRGKYYNARFKNQLKRAYEAQVADVFKAREEDAGQYFIDNSPKMRNLWEQAQSFDDPESFNEWAATLKARKKALGIRNKNVLPTAAAQTMGKRIATAPNPEARALEFSRLQKVFGKHQSQALNEVVNSKSGLDPGLFAAAHMTDQNAKSIIFDVADKDRAKQITESFKNWGKIEESFVDDKVSELMSDYTVAIQRTSTGADGAKVANSLTNLVRLETKKRMALGNTDTEGVVTGVIDDLILKTFDVAESGQSKALIPQKLESGRNTRKQFIESFMTTYSKGENFSDLSIAPSTDQVNSYMETFPDSNDSELLENFYRDIEEQGRWVTNESQTGLKLMIQDKHVLKPIFNSDGDEVEVLFEDINDGYNEKVMDRAGSPISAELRDYAPDLYDSASGIMQNFSLRPLLKEPRSTGLNSVAREVKKNWKNPYTKTKVIEAIKAQINRLPNRKEEIRFFHDWAKEADKNIEADNGR